MQGEKWTPAREAAAFAAELEPLNPNVLFRLSACYGQERDFVNAHKLFERALVLLSPTERVAHLEKFKRLQEQSKDVLDHVYREDPLDILPLEVMLNIFQFALTTDNDIVMKASWVNKRWRNTIVHNCPELWNTWKFTHTSLVAKHVDPKKAVWQERSGGRCSTLQLRDITVTSAAKVTKTILKKAKDATTIDFQARYQDALCQLTRGVPSNTFHHVRRVLLKTNYGWSLRDEGSSQRRLASRSILYGLPFPTDGICELKLVGIDFVSSDRRQRNGTIMSSRLISAPVVNPWSALSRLVIRQCAFDHEHATNDAPAKRFQADLLHTVLRGAPNLEYLDVAISWRDRKQGRIDTKLPVTLPLLRTCRLPPPACWSIDFEAPNLKSLGFTLDSTAGYYNAGADRPLMPLPQDHPLTDNLSTLQSVGLLCSSTDRLSSLEAWIPRLQNVTKLVIRGLGDWPYPDAIPAYMGYRPLSASRASVVALGFLNDNPLSCPKLRTLELHSCFALAATLIAFIRKRQSLAGCAAIEQLILRACSTLSEDAKVTLQQEVAEFKVVSEYQALYEETKRIRDLHMVNGIEHKVQVKEERMSESP